MQFIALWKDNTGLEKSALYNDFESFYSDTFSPAIEVLDIVEMKVSGKTYNEKKADLMKKAILWSLAASHATLSYYELCIIQDFFERNGKRYGLLSEFRENCII